MKKGGTDDGGGGIVVGVVVGGDVVDGGGGGSGVDGVEDVERALDEGRGGVEIVVLHGNPSTHLRELGKWNSAEVDGLGVVVVLESVTEKGFGRERKHGEIRRIRMGKRK